jgi:hypothetical protein
MAEGAAPQPYRYALFGLRFASDFELPQLPAASGVDVDVRIIRCEAAEQPETGTDGTSVQFGPAEQVLAWATVGTFRITGMDRIEVAANPGVSDALVALPLLGSVVATLLQRRGLFVVHASAAVVGGAGFALLGDKGAGKSTTAAALIAAGHGLLADDVVAIDFAAEERPAMLPAFGQLKLWDDAAGAVRGTGLERGERLHALIDKSNYRVAQGFRGEAVPLRRLYILRRGETAGVSAVAAVEAISALLRFSYVGRFGQEGFGPTLGEHFRRCSLLAARGAVRVLEVPGSLERLGEAIEVIERDLVD